MTRWESARLERATVTCISSLCLRQTLIILLFVVLSCCSSSALHPLMSTPADYPGSPDSAAAAAYMASPSPEPLNDASSSATAASASAPAPAELLALLPADVEIIEYERGNEEHRLAFKNLNLAWVAGLFKVEAMVSSGIQAKCMRVAGTHAADSPFCALLCVFVRMRTF